MTHHGGQPPFPRTPSEIAAAESPYAGRSLDTFDFNSYSVPRPRTKVSCHRPDLCELAWAMVPLVLWGIARVQARRLGGAAGAAAWSRPRAS